MGQAARDAMAKVAAVLPTELRERLEDDALSVGPGWERPHAVDLGHMRRALHEGLSDWALPPRTCPGSGACFAP
jgi:predicted DNA-binding transcriptional regulator YafY